MKILLEKNLVVAGLCGKIRPDSMQNPVNPVPARF